MFHSHFERKSFDKVLIFSIVYFPNFKISAFLQLASPSNKPRTQQSQN